MQLTILPISRKEQAFFDLICSINELRELRSELSVLDIEQINQAIEKLCCSTPLENQPSQVCQLFG